MVGASLRDGPERFYQFRMGGTTRERPPLPSLTVMVGDAAAKFRSRHSRFNASDCRSAVRHSSRANSQGWPAGMAARICRTWSGVQ